VISEEVANPAPSLATDHASSAAAAHPSLVDLYGALPLSFEANAGQTDEVVRFLSRGPGYTLFLTPDEAVLALAQPAQARGEGQEASGESSVLRLTLEGANLDAPMSGVDALEGRVNYLIGNDPSQWRTDVPIYQKVHYDEVYEGIDLVFYGNLGQLEYDWVVKPGADPSQIALRIAGAESMAIDAEGDLQLAVAGGLLEMLKPVAYQLLAGERVFVEASYHLSTQDPSPQPFPQGGEEMVRDDASLITDHASRLTLSLGAYDPAQPLIIDPVLSYATYLGGTSTEEDGDIALDKTGAVYLVGQTRSADFPHPNAFTSPAPGGGSLRGTQDAFVAKFGQNGLLVYASYLGGSGIDDAIGVIVDPIGNAIVAGETDSADFPVAASPGTTILQSTKSSGADAFVTKLNQNGSALIFSTYLGGTGDDLGGRVAVNAVNQVYVLGSTTSDDFPGTSGSPIQSTRAGGQDAFVTKLERDGAAILYSTYLGGPGLDVDTGGGIALDAAGNAYVTGDTASTTFTGTAGSLIQPNFGGGATDAFVTKINHAGTAIVYSTFLGGSGDDVSTGIAVDLAGNAYVTGSTTSTGFPGTSTSAIQNTLNGTSDAFVTKINGGGNALVYSTYLGGSGTESGYGIAVDGFGIAHVAGETTSTNFPGAAGSTIQSTNGGGLDAFIVHVSHGGTTLKFSTYLGGSGTDEAPRIAVDAAGSDYVAGTTQSTNFPTFAGQQSGAAGPSDLYLAKIRFDPAGATPGRFVATGAMAVQRADHTATPLADGNVLIVGGRTGSASTALASAEEYDPETGVFTAVGSLSTARYRATATRLADERVLIAGGVDGNGNALSSAEIYNPVTTTFSPAGSMVTARDQATATLLADGRVLIVGGLLTVGGSDTILSSAEIYDPATNSFTATGSMASARYDHTATLLVNGKVLIAGSGPNSLAPASAELFDPETGLFTATGSLITGRGAHTATLLGVGGVLLAGGEDAAGTALASAEIYNPGTGTFTVTGAMSTPRARHQATPLPLFGVVLMTGGASSSASALTVDEIYIPAFGRFSGVGYLGTARAHHTATFTASGQTLIAGGFDAAGAALASAELGTPFNGAVFIVNSTGDEPDVNPGDGFARTSGGQTTLRAAIQEANALAGADLIYFSGLGGAGVKTINALSPLPTITEQVSIDGTTVSTFAGTPVIELNGTSVGGTGLTITAGNSTIRGLVINRFSGHGILLSGAAATGTLIEGNYIGTNAAGTAASANAGSGILVTDAPYNIIGGLTGSTRNVISGNAANGVVISGVGAIGNRIEGNIIGLNAAGTAALGNGTSGVSVSGSRSNSIGGTTLAARNIISGNLNGIQISGASATGNLVQGNYIGTNVAGTAALGNSAYGVLIDGAPNNVIGGTTAGASNVISGNTKEGVRIENAGSVGNLIQGNFIGTDAAGTGPLGNADGGVVVTNGASNNAIGGAPAGAGNTIAFNAFSGVTINGATSTGNRVQGNAIFSNTDLGIDLGDDGVTPNDPGDGDGNPNHLQNFPVLTTAAPGLATISGTLDSAANTSYTLELFASTTGDSSGFGEGQRFLGRSAVTTNGSGQAVYTLSFPASIAVGEIITATATDPNGNTSEFSAGLAVSNSAVATYPLTVKISNLGGTGRVTSLPLGIDTTRSDTTEAYPSGTIVTLTAVPDSGSAFGGWSGFGVNSSDPILKVNVTEARTYTATFLQTGGVAAPVVTFPEASSPWPSTLTFAWEAITPPSGQTLLGYNLYVGRQAGVYDPPIFVPPSTTSLTLTDLPTVEHFFTVTALLGPAGGLGPLSAEAGLRTEDVGLSGEPLLSTQHPALPQTQSSVLPEAAGPAAPIAQEDVYAIPSKSVLFVTVPATGVLANDRDPDGDRLTASLVTRPSHGTLVAFRPDGSFIYEAGPTFSNSDTFTYQATDGSQPSALTTVRIVSAQESGYSVEAVATPSEGLASFAVVDEGTTGGPSLWNGALDPTLGQLSSIDSPSDTSPAQRGTYLFLTNGLLKGRTDYRLVFQLRSDTTGAFGVMFRYADPNNYYRFSMDQAEGYRRLIKMVDGVPVVLREETGLALGGPAYEIGETYQLEIDVAGSELALRLTDSFGLPVVNWSVTDSSLTASGLAVYSARNPGSFYDLVGLNGLETPDPHLVGLQVNVTGTGRGTVSASTSALAFPGSPATTLRAGTAVTLTAQPGPGFTFGGWRQNGVLLSSNPQLPITVNTPTIVEAVFDGTPLPSVNLDVFGDGTVTAEVEGKTILRYLSGVPDSQLVSGVPGGPAPSATTATRSAADIRTFLSSAQNTLLDVDGNGQTNPFTDGRLIYRFLKQREQQIEDDAALMQGAIGPGAKRITADAIRSFLSTYLPGTAAQSADAGLRTEDAGLSGESSVVSSQLSVSASTLEPRTSSLSPQPSVLSTSSETPLTPTLSPEAGARESTIQLLSPEGRGEGEGTPTVEVALPSAFSLPTSALSPQSPPPEASLVSDSPAFSVPPSSFSVSDSVLSPSPAPPLTDHGSRITVPMGFASTFTLQTADLSDGSDDQMLTALPRPWLQDFVVSSAVVEDPNRDVQVMV
jgi:CSLREA domain-containing protein